MTLAVLGPLHLTHGHLWSLTWGEVDDLLYAWRYNEYLRMTKLATLGSWLLNASGNLKHSVKPTDLVGHWVDGKVMSEVQYHTHLKNKIKAKKGAVKNG